MDHYPGISVIIPTFNRGKFIAEAINSVLMQEYKGRVEIIVSDDGSFDNTLSIVSNFGDKVKIIRKPTDCLTQGAAAARNRGIAVSTQPFVCFLDSDDFYLRDHFIRMAKILDENVDLGFAFCRILECKEEDGKRKFRPWTYPKVNKRDIINPVVSRSHIVHTNSFMFRREVFETAGNFNESYRNGEDGDLWMRISELYKGAFADHFGAVYKSIHGDGQLTKNNQEEVNKSYLIIFNEGIRRYYQLKLKDRFRIFKLKHNRLNFLYNTKKSVYYFKYLQLIFRYPTSFMYILHDYYYNYRKKKENVFTESSHFYSKQTFSPDSYFTSRFLKVSK